MGRVTSWWTATKAAAQHRELEHQVVDHQQRDEAWNAERRDLVDALSSAEANESWTVDTIGRPLTFQPKRGERIHLVVDGAGLVEHRRKAGHWTSGYSGFSVRVTKGLRWNVGGSRGTYVPGPEEPTLIDSGTATITDRRVVFQGSKQSREWAYPKLLGYQHESTAPVTLIHVSNRQKVSGILYDSAAGPLFQLRLATAIAHSNGTEGALIAGLRGELQQHDATRPLPPPPVAPSALAATPVVAVSGRALATYRRWPRWGRIAAPLVAVLVVLSALSSVFSSEPQHASTNDAAPVPTTVQATTSTAEHIVTTTTEASTTTTAAPTTTTTLPPTTTTAPPTPTTAAYVAPVTTQRPSCNPNYSPCVPNDPVDVDCAGGGGNGPSFVAGPVNVIGSDVYGLDGNDNDGIGCE
jgi:hypothetical protein